MSLEAGWSQKWVFALGVLLLQGCASLPTPKVSRHVFPKEGVYLGEPDRPYEVLGLVRAQATWPTLLLPDSNEDALCRNHYNKAVGDLLKRARAAGGDAVAQVRSVVFLATGKRETYTTPECSDDGESGEILMEGVAVRFKKTEPISP